MWFLKIIIWNPGYILIDLKFILYLECILIRMLNFQQLSER